MSHTFFRQLKRGRRTLFLAHLARIIGPWLRRRHPVGLGWCLPYCVRYRRLLPHGTRHAMGTCGTVACKWEHIHATDQTLGRQHPGYAAFSGWCMREHICGRHASSLLGSAAGRARPSLCILQFSRYILQFSRYIRLLHAGGQHTDTQRLNLNACHAPNPLDLPS